MADISMCHGGKCPMKEKCYRYLGKPTPEWQSYFVKPPYNKKAGACEYFWDIHPNEKHVDAIDCLVAAVHGKGGLRGADAAGIIAKGMHGRTVENVGRDVDKYGPLDPLHSKYWDVVANM